MRTMFDAAVPQSVSRISGFDVAAGYIGYPNATPHVWSIAEWNSQPCRYRLPIFVPSWFAGMGWDTVRDVNAIRSALTSLGVPVGSTVGLDMETQIQPSYVSILITQLNKAGYGMLVYGSKSYVYQNPLPNGSQSGYWPADWNGTPHMASGVNVWATQYGSQTGPGYDYDVNLISESVPLWDTQSGGASMSLELNTPVPASPVMTQRYPDITGLGFNPGDAPQFGTLIGWMGARVAHIGNRVDQGIGVANSLSDADVQRIAVAVAKEISKGLSNG